jgi:hypothetical protein
MLPERYWKCTAEKQDEVEHAEVHEQSQHHLLGCANFTDLFVDELGLSLQLTEFELLNKPIFLLYLVVLAILLRYLLLEHTQLPLEELHNDQDAHISQKGKQLQHKQNIEVVGQGVADIIAGEVW